MTDTTLAAPDKGSVYQVAVCTHCSRDIILMPGDNLWVHDNTGWQRCDGLPDSTPKERHAHLSIV
jgi:hypothetical protein